MESEFDAIIVVSADESLQKERMKSRDGLSESEISSRLSSQIPLSEKTVKATWVIQNHGSLEDLKNIVQALLPKIKNL